MSLQATPQDRAAEDHRRACLACHTRGMVEPLHARAPEAVPGPFYVQSDQCIICALPPETAPNNIQFLPNAADERCPHCCYVHKQPETIGELQRTLEAVCFSCVGAIRYCGTDPSILQSLEAAGARDQCDASATRNA